MWQTDGKIPLHAPGDKFLRYLCKHQLSLHLDISGLGAWALLHYICEIFGHSFIIHFDSANGAADQKYCWACGFAFTFRWWQPWLPFHLMSFVRVWKFAHKELSSWRQWWGHTPGVSQSLAEGYMQCQKSPPTPERLQRPFPAHSSSLTPDLGRYIPPETSQAEKRRDNWCKEEMLLWDLLMRELPVMLLRAWVSQENSGISGNQEPPITCWDLHTISPDRAPSSCSLWGCGYPWWADVEHRVWENCAIIWPQLETTGFPLTEWHETLSIDSFSMSYQDAFILLVYSPIDFFQYLNALRKSMFQQIEWSRSMIESHLPFQHQRSWLN